MRTRHFLLLLLAVSMVAGCYLERKDPEPEPTPGWPGTLIGYYKAVSERHGIVGYVKEVEYAKPGMGASFRTFHVLDLDFSERGILNQSGTGTKFVDLAPDTARVTGRLRDEIPLEAHPLGYNVADCLGVVESGPVKVVKATEADVRRTPPPAE